MIEDPFKLRTYGVKKPLDLKEDKIQKLLDDNKRYYPINRNGQVDEWSAVIKHQAEQYNLEIQQKAQFDAQQKKKYFDELLKAEEYKKQQKSIQEVTLRRELEIQQQYTLQNQNFTKQINDQRIDLKRKIGQLNQRQLQDIQQQTQLQQENKIELESQIIEKAKRDQSNYESLMQMKKQMYQQVQLEDLENKRQKQYPLSQISTNSLIDILAKNNSQSQEWRKLNLHTTRDSNRNQLIVKDKHKEFQQKQLIEDQKDAQHYLKFVSSTELQMRDQKKQAQNSYRQILDKQLKISEIMHKNSGTMTNQEKKMNKRDLGAYKIYENNQYALIPGVKNQINNNQASVNRYATEAGSVVQNKMDLNNSKEYFTQNNEAKSVIPTGMNSRNLMSGRQNDSNPLGRSLSALNYQLKKWRRQSIKQLIQSLLENVVKQQQQEWLVQF
eukprot:403355400